MSRPPTGQPLVQRFLKPIAEAEGRQCEAPGGSPLVAQENLGAGTIEAEPPRLVLAGVVKQDAGIEIRRLRREAEQRLPAVPCAVENGAENGHRLTQLP